VEPAHSASIVGEWVLANPERTQFVGAKQVELHLYGNGFTLTAYYPGEEPLVVDGTASYAPDGGLMTLTPTANSRELAGSVHPLLPKGQTIVVLATAADNTMVFAQPDDALRAPSSVWHRREAARKAGLYDATLSRDSSRIP
jgi:hypothetical protein